MQDDNYRSAMYQNYTSVQAPGVEKDNIEASAIGGAAALMRLDGWLPVDKGAKCLDLGCGSGRFLHSLRAIGYAAVSGVDLCPQAVILARKGGFEVAQGDLREYLLESRDHFDLITAFDVIEHFRKDELLDLLSLVRTHLASSGRFIIQTPNACSPWASAYRYGDLTHELILDPRCVGSVLRLSGFSDTCVREVRPHVHGALSALRWCGWKMLWLVCALWNLIETGSTQGGIYTRNMIVLTRNCGDPQS